MKTRTNTYFLKFIPIYLFKQAYGQKLYLQGLMPILGLYHLIRKRELYFLYLPFLLIFVLGSLYALSHGAWSSMARNFQVVALIFFAHFLMNLYKDKEWDTLFKIIIACGLAYSLFEIIYSVIFIPNAFIPRKDFLITSIRLPYFRGIVGEANYTGFLYGGLSSLLLLRKSYRLYFFALILIFLTGSRMGLLMSLLALGIPLFNNKKVPSKLYSTICWSALILALCYPGILIFIESFASDGIKLFLIKASNGRYAIHQAYVFMFLDHPFGVGAFQGPELFAQYAPFATKLYNFSFLKYQQHGQFIQVLSEYGIWGYALYAFFNVQLLHLCLKYQKTFAWGFICLITGQLFLNIFNEYILYLLLAYYSVHIKSVASSDEKALKKLVILRNH